MNPSKSQEYFTLSSEALSSNQVSEAKYWCNQALKEYPQHKEAHLRMGNILSVQGKYKEASDAYMQYLFRSRKEGNPFDIAQAHNAFGQLYFQQLQTHQALTHFFIALKSLAESKAEYRARIYNNIALTYASVEQFQKALEYYFHALRINKKHKMYAHTSYCYFNIAILFKKQRKYIRAMRYMKKYRSAHKRVQKHRGKL